MSSKTNRKIFSVLGQVSLADGRKRFVPHSIDFLNTCISSLPLGKGILCTFYDHVPTRSEQQLDYHWVLVSLMAEHTGYTKEELHDAIMRMKFGTKVIQLAGHSVMVRKSISNTGGMTVAEVAELITFDLELCGRLSIHVPTPEELGYISNRGGYASLTPVRKEKSLTH
jgi:hypothetical protein